MNINYIENHLNASLITECKGRITNCLRSRTEFSSACPLQLENINDPHFIYFC